MAIPARARDEPIEIWFQDEARVGQLSTLTRVWARRGATPAPGRGATPVTTGPTSFALNNTYLIDFVFDCGDFSGRGPQCSDDFIQNPAISVCQ